MNSSSLAQAEIEVKSELQVGARLTDKELNLDLNPPFPFLSLFDFLWTF